MLASLEEVRGRVFVIPCSNELGVEYRQKTHEARHSPDTKVEGELDVAPRGWVDSMRMARANDMTSDIRTKNRESTILIPSSPGPRHARAPCVNSPAYAPTS